MLGDDGISPICSTSRNASPLSVFMYALSREYGSQNINGHTSGIAGRRTLINEIGSGRYYGYRRCSQISVQHPNIAMRCFIACRVCRVLAWFPSCCGLAVFSSLTVSAPDPWVLPACTPGVGGCACSGSGFHRAWHWLCTDTLRYGKPLCFIFRRAEDALEFSRLLSGVVCRSASGGSGWTC